MSHGWFFGSLGNQERKQKATILYNQKNNYL